MITRRPTCPLPELLQGIAQYAAVGVPASQLVIALPRYGYDYPCTTEEPGSACLLVPSPSRVEPTLPTDQLSDALFLLRNGSTTTGLMFDQKTASSWFDYTDSAGRAAAPGLV